MPPASPQAPPLARRVERPDGIGTSNKLPAHSPSNPEPPIKYRFMGAILYDVAPTDPSTFATVGLAVVGLGMLASFVPARRASNIDPLQALREE